MTCTYQTTKLSVCSSAYLQLRVDENKLICDERMQWIKTGENQGWMEWASSERGICTNIPNTDWHEIPKLANKTCEYNFLTHRLMGLCRTLLSWKRDHFRGIFMASLFDQSNIGNPQAHCTPLVFGQQIYENISLSPQILVQLDH